VTWPIELSGAVPAPSTVDAAFAAAGTVVGGFDAATPSIKLASSGVRAADPAAPGSVSAPNSPGATYAPVPAANAWLANRAPPAARVPAASPSTCEYIWAISVNAKPVRASSSWAAVFRASIAAASAANAIAACIETSSAPAGTNPVNDGSAAAPEPRARLATSTNCDPIAAAPGLIDIDSMCSLLLLRRPRVQPRWTSDQF